MFLYNPIHQVIVCQACGSCIIPGRSGQERHLRRAPHLLSGDVLRATLTRFSTYKLRTLQQLQEHKPQVTDKCSIIPYLTSYAGFYCPRASCRYYCTQHLPDMRKHVASAHQLQAQCHSHQSPLWQACRLQTYFIAIGRVDYFIIVGGVRGRVGTEAGTGAETGAGAGAGAGAPNRHNSQGYRQSANREP